MGEKLELQRIAQRLRQRSRELRERELLQEVEAAGPFIFTHLPGDRLRRAFALKEALLHEFAGLELDDLYTVEERETEFGPVCMLHERLPLPLKLPSPEQAKELLAHELQLVYSIGPRIASELRAQGYRTIHDLERHERFRGPAMEVLKHLECRDLGALWERITRFLFKTHPTALALAGLAEGLLFLDLESLGLFGRPLVLVGLAWYDRDRQELIITQYVIRSIVEEQAVLAAAQRELDRAEVLVSYNGRAFDVNYLEERLSYYGLYREWPGAGAETEKERPHLDLLHHVRRWFSLPDCRLESVERFILGIERPLDLPSILVPDFYNTYLEERNIGPLVAIIEHNKQDLISLALLLDRLLSRLDDR